MRPKNQVTPDAIMQLGMAFRSAKTLLSALELGIFSKLAASGTLDAEELCERVGLHRAAPGTSSTRWSRRECPGADRPGS